jgi:hypothetical protein
MGPVMSRAGARAFDRATDADGRAAARRYALAPPACSPAGEGIATPARSS